MCNHKNCVPFLYVDNLNNATQDKLYMAITSLNPLIKITGKVFSCSRIVLKKKRQTLSHCYKLLSYRSISKENHRIHTAFYIWPKILQNNSCKLNVVPQRLQFST